MTNVTISGFSRGVPEWATEDTLREIRDYMQTQVTLETASMNNQKKTSDQNNKDNSKFTKRLGGVMQKSMFGIKNAMIAGGASYEKIIKSGFQVASDSLIERFGPFGIALSAATVAAIKFNDLLMDINGIYTEVYNSGVSLSGSFVDIVNAAGLSEMSLIDYASAASDNARVVAALTTPYQDGAMAFGSLIKNVRTNLVGFGQLGMATGDVVELLGDYMETQRLIGLNDQVSDAYRSRVLSEYLQQVTALSQITGKNRKQIAREMQERLRDPGFAAFMASQGETVKESMTLAVSGLAGVSGDVAQLFQEMLQFGGPVNDNTALLASTLGNITPEMQNLATRVRNGEKIGREEMEKLIRRWGKGASEIYKEQGEHLGLAAKQNGTFANVIQTLQDMANTTGKTNVKFSDELTRLYNNLGIYFDKAIAPITQRFSKILDYLVKENGPLDQFAGWVAKTIEWFIGISKKLFNGDLIKEWTDSVTTFVDDSIKSMIQMYNDTLQYANETWEDIKTKAFNIWNSIKFFGIKIAKDTWQSIKDHAFGIWDTVKNKVTEIFKSAFSVISWFPGFNNNNTTTESQPAKPQKSGGLTKPENRNMQADQIPSPMIGGTGNDLLDNKSESMKIAKETLEIQRLTLMALKENTAEQKKTRQALRANGDPY